MKCTETQDCKKLFRDNYDLSRHMIRVHGAVFNDDEMYRYRSRNTGKVTTPCCKVEMTESGYRKHKRRGCPLLKEGLRLFAEQEGEQP